MREAAAILADLKDRVATGFKGDRDPVTEARRASEAFLLAALGSLHPGDGFREGGGSSRQGSTGCHRVADPMDGTVIRRVASGGLDLDAGNGTRPWS